MFFQVMVFVYKREINDLFVNILIFHFYIIFATYYNINYFSFITFYISLIHIVSNRPMCVKNSTLFKLAHILNVHNLIDFIQENNMVSKILWNSYIHTFDGSIKFRVYVKINFIILLLSLVFFPLHNIHNIHNIYIFVGH